MIRKMTPMDVVALLHPGIKQLSVARREREWRPLPNTHKAVLDNLYRAEYLEHLNISGMRECEGFLYTKIPHKATLHSP